MTMIDERARRAATDVHVAVAGTEPPGVPSRSPLLRPAAVVVALLLIALAAWLAIRGGQDDAADVVTEPGAKVTPLVLAEVPEGLHTALAIEGGGEDPDPDGTWSHGTVWGPAEPDSSAPWLEHTTSGSVGDPALGDPVVLGPYEGLVDEETATDRIFVNWTADGVEHSVTGHHVGRDEIVAVAAAIAVGDDPTEVLPDLVLVYRGPFDLVYATAIPVPVLEPDSWLVAYRDDQTDPADRADPARTLAIAGGLRPGLVDVLRLAGTDGRTVSVRGVDGWATRFEDVFGYGDGPLLLGWEDPTGQEVILAASGFDLDTVVAMADELHELSPQEWDDLRTGPESVGTFLEPGDPTPTSIEVGTGSLIPGPTPAEIGRGTLPDGRPWTAIATFEPGVDRAEVAAFLLTVDGGPVPLETKLSPGQPDGTVDLNVGINRDLGIVVGATTDRITFLALTDRMGPFRLPLVTLPDSPLQFFANDWEATLPVPRDGSLLFTAQWGPDPDFTSVEFP